MLKPVIVGGWFLYYVFTVLLYMPVALLYIKLVTSDRVYCYGCESFLSIFSRQQLWFRWPRYNQAQKSLCVSAFLINTKEYCTRIISFLLFFFIWSRPVICVDLFLFLFVCWPVIICSNKTFLNTHNLILLYR